MKKTEDCSHRTQSNPIQSMDGSNPCPTLHVTRLGLYEIDDVGSLAVLAIFELKCRFHQLIEIRQQLQRQTTTTKLALE